MKINDVHKGAPVNGFTFATIVHACTELLGRVIGDTRAPAAGVGHSLQSDLLQYW